MKLKTFIDTNKGITFLVILAMMAYFHQWDNTTAWVYLALHGTYGFLWVLKSRLFPDASWERKIPLWFGIVSWLSLALYWVPPYLLTRFQVQAPPWLLALAISLNLFGVFFTFTADMQKFTSLKLRPGTLVADGMLSLSRNINYFGEFLIYLAFAILPMNWLAFIPLALFIGTFWVPNMLRKEKSLATLPGFDAYKQRTRFFIPYIF